jgi:hypothetical protein
VESESLSLHRQAQIFSFSTSSRVKRYPVNIDFLLKVPDDENYGAETQEDTIAP